MRLTSARTIPLMIFACAWPWFVGMAATPLSSVQDVRFLEKQVKTVVEKALPATVSLFSKRVGSSGSGVVVSEDGLILTAGHVVQGMEKVTVVFPDGNEVPATVLGANFSKDSAMVQLEEPGPWPFVELGDSEKLEIGEFVVSLGHAGGYDAVRSPPVRFGRVLAKDGKGFVGTDCTLIGGDSGGPLFDLNAQVVGIHSSIGGPLTSNHHTGMANFKEDWKDLLQGKTWGKLAMPQNPLADPDRPVIGFIIGGEVEKGVLIGEVAPHSPASLAGLQAGDVVIRINGQRVRTQQALHARLGRFDPGDEIVVAILRAGEITDYKIRLARLGDVHGR